MEINQIVLLGYALFLAVMLLINFLYFFQVYRYRLPGDASVGIMVIHIILLLVIVMGTTIYIGSLS
jgi:hypothetical protein